MNKNIVSFVSTKGRALNLDLQVIKNHLNSDLPDVEFKYYLNKATTKLPAINKTIDEGKKIFCAEASNLICMDASIPVKIPTATDGQKRLLVATPYDYQFSAFFKYSNSTLKKKKTFIRCTDVIPGSPFTSKLLKTCYEWDDSVTFWDNIPHPVSWDILQAEKQTSARKRIEFYYPQIKGKKILSLMLYDEPQNKSDDIEIQNPFQDFNLKELMDILGNDWFLITNNKYILEIANQLPYTYSHSFGYTKNIINVNDLLYTSDMLITNSSKNACCFSITKKPIYCLDYAKKFWGKYIRQFYPELYLRSINDILKIPFRKNFFSKELENFSHEFSYAPEKNPFDVIGQLFK